LQLGFTEVAVMKVLRLEEQTRDLRLPELLLLAGIIIVLFMLAASIRSDSERPIMQAAPDNWLSQAAPIQQLIAYVPDNNSRDKLALTPSAFSGTVTLRGNEAKDQQLRVQKLENTVEQGRTPWHGEPVIGERTTQSLPYVSP